jgi:hypothetical protein
MRLRDCGLVERADAREGHARKCLFYLGEIEVDVMPPHVPELGCPSRMLEIGFEFPEPHLIDAELEIFTLSAPALLAAKLEAFFDRRTKTYKDLDDIVAILDGRLRIDDEIANSPAEMRWFIASGFRSLLSDGHVLDIISDTLREPTREKRLLEMMRTLSAKLS